MLVQCVCFLWLCVNAWEYVFPGRTYRVWRLLCSLLRQFIGTLSAEGSPFFTSRRNAVDGCARAIGSAAYGRIALWLQTDWGECQLGAKWWRCGGGAALRPSFGRLLLLVNRDSSLGRPQLPIEIKCKDESLTHYLYNFLTQCRARRITISVLMILCSGY